MDPGPTVEVFSCVSPCQLSSPRPTTLGPTPFHLPSQCMQGGTFGVRLGTPAQPVVGADMSPHRRLVGICSRRTTLRRPGIPYVCMSRHVTPDNPHRTSVGVSSLGRLLTILGDINGQTLCVCPFVRSRDPACDGVLYVSFVLHIDHSPPPSGHANLQANAQPHLHSPPYPPLATPTHTQSGSSSQTLSPPRHRPTIFNR